MTRGSQHAKAEVILVTAAAPAYVTELAKALSGMRAVRVIAAEQTGALHGLARQVRHARRGHIVHIHAPHKSYLGLAPFFLARLMGSKIVFTVDDPQPQHEPAYRMADRLTVAHKSTAEFLIKDFGIAPSKIVVIPVGACHLRTPAAPFPAFDALKLLYFGSIRESKGLHMAIEAVQRLNRGHGRRVRLTIAGNVPHPSEQDYWQRCEQLIATQPEGIWVTDRYIAESEVSALITQHHAVLLPYQSFWSESGAAGRALSNGRAVLSTQSRGLASLLAESGSAVAIEGKSAGAIARAIQNAFLAGPVQLEQMGARGRQFMLAQRSWDAIALETEAVYESLHEHQAQPLRSLTPAQHGPG